MTTQAQDELQAAIDVHARRIKYKMSMIDHYMCTRVLLEKTEKQLEAEINEEMKAVRELQASTDRQSS